MEKIEAWKTNDGKVWETEYAAKKHQAELDALCVFEEVYYRGMIESANDIINLLIEHKNTILDFYGVA